ANNPLDGGRSVLACGCQSESLFSGRKGLQIMLKKIGFVALIVVAGFLVLRSTKLGSYAGTAWGKIRAGANNQVPVEFEIDRIRHEVAQLVPDMKKHLSVIAEEMVAIDNLREEITTTRANLESQRQSIAQMTKDLK